MKDLNIDRDYKTRTIPRNSKSRKGETKGNLSS